jgi:hypothetical protein
VLSLPFVALLAAAVMPLHVGSLAFPIIGVLLGVLPSPATAGLQYMCRRMVQREPTGAGDQWDGFRFHARAALGFWVISLVGTAVIAANLVVYSGSHLAAFRLLQILWIYILLFWLALHLYVYPLLMRQEGQPLLVYRNAFVMMARRPLFSAIVATVWLLVLILSVIAGPILIVGFAISAAIQQVAAARLLVLFNAASP